VFGLFERERERGNLWYVPSQMKRHLRTSMCGWNTDACWARILLFHSVRRDDQISVPKFIELADLALEVLFDADRAGALLKNIEQAACGLCRKSRGRWNECAGHGKCTSTASQ